MEKGDILRLISFHEEALAQYRFLLLPSVVELEEQTVKALWEMAYGIKKNLRVQGDRAKHPEVWPQPDQERKDAELKK